MNGEVKIYGRYLNFFFVGIATGDKVSLIISVPTPIGTSTSLWDLVTVTCPRQIRPV